MPSFSDLSVSKSSESPTSTIADTGYAPVRQAGVLLRKKASALTFPRKALKRHSRPEELVTDRLRTNDASLNALGRGDDHEMGRWVNNRAENAHLLFSIRERAMLRFRRMRRLQMSASVHASVLKYFNQERYLSSRSSYKSTRTAALPEWPGLFAA